MTDERCHGSRYAIRTDLCTVAAKVCDRGLGDKGLSARFDIGNINARLRISKNEAMTKLAKDQARIHCTGVQGIA